MTIASVGPYWLGSVKVLSPGGRLSVLKFTPNTPSLSSLEKHVQQQYGSVSDLKAKVMT